MKKRIITAFTAIVCLFAAINVVAMPNPLKLYDNVNVTGQYKFVDKSKFTHGIFWFQSDVNVISSDAFELGAVSVGDGAPRSPFVFSYTNGYITSRTGRLTCDFDVGVDSNKHVNVMPIAMEVEAPLSSGGMIRMKCNVTYIDPTTPVIHATVYKTESF